MEPFGVLQHAWKVDAGLVDMALEGLSDDDLMKRPNPECNPIGWTLWHQCRYEDWVIAGIAGDEQVWTSGIWPEKFGLPADPNQLGMGDSIDEVMALKPTIEHLKGYIAAVREKTLACLESVTPDDLDREVDNPSGGTRTVGQALGILVLDHFHHSGQVTYLRGYVMGKGWFGA